MAIPNRDVAEVHQQVEPKTTSFLAMIPAKSEIQWLHMVRKQASGS